MTDTTPQITDPRPLFSSAAATAMEVVDAVTPDRYDAPTPCPGMTVRELLDHLGMAVGRVTAAGTRRPLEEWPTEGFSLGDDAAGAFRVEVGRAVEAWGDGTRLTEEVQLPWTVTSGAGALGTYVNELLVHTWDLATATGQEPSWDAATVEGAMALILPYLPDAERGPMWDEFRRQIPEGVPFDPPFADAVPVGDDATPIERLVAWNGRDPKAFG